MNTRLMRNGDKLDFLEVNLECVENMERGEKIMCFDWDKAAELIIEHDIVNAEAFIHGDEEGTSGLILYDSKLVGDHGAVLESYNSYPMLRDCDTKEEYACYFLRPVTNWTVSAVMRLTGGVKCSK